MIIPTSQNDYAAGFADGYRQGKKDAERKKGQWCITYADSKLHGIRPFIRVCSSCASVSNHCYNYCPNCGARMEE